MNHFFERLQRDWSEILTKSVEHINVALISVAIACLIAIPLGVYCARYERLAKVNITIVSVIQTIPSLALFGFLIPIVGIGTKPAIIALTLYALLPILQNTYEGIKGVDKSVIEAGLGMGMTTSQLLWKVQLPVARSYIMAGLRLATVHAISGATIASYIAAGGLGDIITRGLSSIDTITLLEGALPVSLLVIIANILLFILYRLLTPKGLRHTLK
ncbi:ABC transporter permease [Paenibacillus sp. MMO-177]|uniref:ABC transporter permease n=1 Tax=Paenibacillus sp. MMO-177 TaxID=3081289 RepID=UPI00301B021E